MIYNCPTNTGWPISTDEMRRDCLRVRYDESPGYATNFHAFSLFRLANLSIWFVALTCGHLTVPVTYCASRLSAKVVRVKFHDMGGAGVKL